VPRVQDVVSIDTALLSGLVNFGATHVQARVDLLQQCSVVDQSPWDGCQDMLTIELAPMDEYTCRAQAAMGRDEAEPAHGGLRLTGLSELLLGCQVMIMSDDEWRQLQTSHASARDVLVRGDWGLEAQDVEMLALFLALQLGRDSADTEGALEQDATALIARLTREGVTLLATREEQSCSVSHERVAGAEGEAAKEAREDGTESDSDDDDDEELDWMALVGERAEKAPWLRSQAVVAAASLVVERRAARLSHPLPTIGSEADGARAGRAEEGGEGGDPSRDAVHVEARADDIASWRRLLSMAQRLRQLEGAVLQAAQGALCALPLAPPAME
jgi:hypothetical protein